jgi:hypothetical protein
MQMLRQLLFDRKPATYGLTNEQVLSAGARGEELASSGLFSSPDEMGPAAPEGGNAAQAWPRWARFTRSKRQRMDTAQRLQGLKSLPGSTLDSHLGRNLGARTGAAHSRRESNGQESDPSKSLNDLVDRLLDDLCSTGSSLPANEAINGSVEVCAPATPFYPASDTQESLSDVVDRLLDDLFSDHSCMPAGKCADSPAQEGAFSDESSETPGPEVPAETAQV